MGLLHLDAFTDSGMSTLLTRLSVAVAVVVGSLIATYIAWTILNNLGCRFEHLCHYIPPIFPSFGPVSGAATGEDLSISDNTISHSWPDTLLHKTCTR